MISYILPLATLIVGSLAANTSSVGTADFTRTQTDFTASVRKSTTSQSPIPTQTSVTLLWNADGGITDDDDDRNHGFSVVSADGCSTVYVTTVSNGVPVYPDITTYTITQSKSQFEETFSTSASDSIETWQQTCSPEGTTILKCSGAFSYSASGTGISQTFTSTVTAKITSYTYPVTAGASMLASATGTCTKPANAAPTSLSKEIYKVIVVPAAAVVAAALI